MAPPARERRPPATTTAGTAWNAGLRPAQRAAGPRRRRPKSPGWLPSRHLPPSDETAYSRRRRGFLPVGLDTTTPRAAGGSLPSAFTERRHVARTVTNGVCHSQVRIPPNAEIPAGTAPPRNGESFPPPAFGGLCRPEAGPVLPVGAPSRPRRRVAANLALPATVSMRNDRPRRQAPAPARRSGERVVARRAGAYRMPSNWIPRTKYRWVKRKRSAIGSAAATPATIWYGQLIS